MERKAIVQLIGGIIASLIKSFLFWIFWTWCGIGARFFYFLPVPYKAMRYWEVVGLFFVIWCVKFSLFPKAIVAVNVNSK